MFPGQDQQPAEGKITESTHVIVETTVRSTEVIPAASNPPTNQSASGSSRKDDDAIAKLESEELQRQSRVEELEAKRREMNSSQSEPWSEEQMRSWKSMELLRSGNKLKVLDQEHDDPQLRVSRDMESLIQGQPKLEIKSSHRFFDLDQEKERMQRWIEEQEKKLKVPPHLVHA